MTYIILYTLQTSFWDSTRHKGGRHGDGRKVDMTKAAANYTRRRQQSIHDGRQQSILTLRKGCSKVNTRAAAKRTRRRQQSRHEGGSKVDTRAAAKYTRGWLQIRRDNGGRKVDTKAATKQARRRQQIRHEGVSKVDTRAAAKWTLDTRAVVKQTWQGWLLYTAKFIH